MCTVLVLVHGCTAQVQHVRPQLQGIVALGERLPQVDAVRVVRHVRDVCGG